MIPEICINGNLLIISYDYCREKHHMIINKSDIVGMKLWGDTARIIMKYSLDARIITKYSHDASVNSQSSTLQNWIDLNYKEDAKNKYESFNEHLKLLYNIIDPERVKPIVKKNEEDLLGIQTNVSTISVLDSSKLTTDVIDTTDNKKQ